MILKAVKKPIKVECVIWTGKNFEEIREFCGKQDPTLEEVGIESDYVAKIEGYVPHLFLYNSDGSFHMAREGDYIIKSVNGECHPCKKDLFEEIYDII